MEKVIDKSIASVEKAIGYSFKDKSLLSTALNTAHTTKRKITKNWNFGRFGYFAGYFGFSFHNSQLFAGRRDDRNKGICGV